MTTLTTILMLAAAAALLLFPVCYHVSTHGAWRNSAMGVHLMSFMGVFAMVMVLVVARIVGYHVPAWVRPVVWGSIAIVSWWRLALLFTLQARKDRR